MGAFFEPHLSPHVQDLIRTGYGALLLLFLIQTLPVSRWFFVSDRWRGYAKSGPLVDLLQNPVALCILMPLWMASATALMIGVLPVPAAIVNLLLCRYFFIHMRWKGVLRGGGAPGFMSYWFAAVVFALEYSGQHDPNQIVRPIALLAVKVDLALIMLSAGVYKMLAGYPQNNGMELGVVNPFWGYWYKFYQKIPPGHIVFRGMNHLAYLTEIVAAILMLIPPLQFWGGLAITLSFLFICSHIRLGFLTEMVMLTGLLYVERGTAVDAWLQAIPVPASQPSPAWLGPISAAAPALRVFFWVYLVMLPVAHAGHWYNFLARRRLPGFLQTLHEKYANFFGIIIWRVFTIDVINFFCRIRFKNAAAGTSREYTQFDYPDPASRFRFWHVSEFVCFVSVFTTLKYFPTNADLFRERLLRYTRTMPYGPGETVLYEYYAVQKTDKGFDFHLASEFEVEPEAGRVDERTLDRSVDVRAPHKASPVHAGAVPGSYAPGPRTP